VTYLFLIGGLGLLVVGAEALVRGSVQLARRMGVSPLIAGLTLVAWGTSSPELVVSVQASLAGQGGLSLGNAVGSNIVNLSVILGLTAVVRPLRVASEMARREAPLLLVVTIAAALLIGTTGLMRWEGALLLAVLIGWTYWQARTARTAIPDTVEALESVPPPHAPVWTSALLAAAGLAGLVVGSDLFVRGATDLAEAWGWSAALIGLTVVAIGTSLPELATSVVGVLRGEGDLAVGNVIGSNLFNLMGVLGVASVASPIGGGLLLPVDLWTMLGLTVFGLIALWTGLRIERWEGVLLLIGYGVYVWYRMGQVGV
jgi:cation:H+ antiporter